MPTSSLLLICACVILMPIGARAAEAELSDEDRAFLGNLIKSGLWDPLPPGAGQESAKRVRVRAISRSCWGHQAPYEAVGWLKPAQEPRPALALLDNLALVPDPHVLETLNWEREWKDLLRPEPPKATGEGAEREEIFAKMGRTRSGAISETEACVFWAAWLLRLGRTDDAARIWAKAKVNLKDPDAFKREIRAEMAWRAFSEAVNAFILRADAEALLQVERLLETFGDIEEFAAQGKSLYADLKRRKEGRGRFFAKPPPAKAIAMDDEDAPRHDWPQDFEGWEKQKQIEYLIRELEEVDARQMGQPGGVSLSSDPRIRKLIEIGDPAVPALIECFENDTRLMRSMHFWRDFSHSRTILAVREGALTALMSILRTSFFEPRSTGDNFTSQEGKDAKRTVEAIKSYWSTYGKLDLAERMMKILTDDKASADAWREAADNLARPNDRPTR